MCHDAPVSDTPGPSSAATTRPHDRLWWRDAVVYQIYPRSFADSNGDGVGDLPGALSRLPYLARLGVDAVWFSPFYVSPQRDAGYDVADHRDIDPLFGTLADLDRLVAEAHRLGLRVIVDLVPNHTSSDHPWFRKALAGGPDSPERDRYVFRDGRGEHGEIPPNDWVSVFGGPAWTRVDDGHAAGRTQWYLHLFDSGQPDLNWSHPDVPAEFESILRFWLDRGVDGFRVDVAHGLVKGEGLPNWIGPHHGLRGDDPTRGRPPMWDQEGVHEIFRSWRRILEEYPHTPILVAEAWVRPASRQARYVRPDEMHQSFNFEYVLTPWHAGRLRRVITTVLDAHQAVDAPATWVLSNHDVIRHATRLALDPQDDPPNGIGADDPQPDRTLGARRARAATLLMLALPGAAYLYQGEELGLPEHTSLPDEARQDPTWFRTRGTQRGRDGARVPLPWRSGAPSYGFGPGPASWLPAPPDWDAYAVDSQEGVEGSCLETYREALRMRRALRLGAGALRWQEVTGAGTPHPSVLPDQASGPWQEEAATGVLALRNGSILVVTNLGCAPVPLPEGAEVILTSWGRDGVEAGDTAPPREVPADTTVWARLPGHD